MRFLLLATDYDGTLAADGKVDDATLDALVRLRKSGRKSLLVTGRHMPDLCNVFPQLNLFDGVIAENGGLLYRPDTREETLLCEAPNERFVALLKERGVPFSVGRTIVATWQPNEEAVLCAIRDLGLDLQVIFNKGAVMVLPAGISKGTGLQAALDVLGISRHNVVAVGDAENDLAFMRVSGCSVAVANALPSVMENADIVLDKPRGAGVADLCERLMADDLAQFKSSLQRYSISLGHRVESRAGVNGEQQVLVHSTGESILVTGPSGSGKSTFVSGLLEQLVQQDFQFCLIDAEGDYAGFTDAASFGTAREAPDTKAVFRALESPRQSVLVDLLGVSVDDRPGFFATMLPHLQDLRSRTARPHWLIIDEAHHMLPSSWSMVNNSFAQVLENTILITVHPDHVAKTALEAVGIVVAIGTAPMAVLKSFAQAVGVSAPSGHDRELAFGEALVWFRKTRQAPLHVKVIQSKRERLRHLRNYAEGELSPDQSFYFRGPESKLNLRAHNLITFLQLADGVDDETWMYHLRRGDYSAWFESMIKDQELARQAAEIEQGGFSPQESRQKIREMVESRYTAPA
ncbi:MAG TPA: HAD-IIB family hydrolase [Candidatus Sulfotelmatobacter sp.]